METEHEACASAQGGEPVGIPSPRGVVRTLSSVLARPGPLSREVARLARDTGRIVRGVHEIAPSPKDRRFADPAWTANPAYRRLVQEYLAVSDALTRLIDDFEDTGADWREVEQARFILTAVTSALAPTNTLIGNPAALKRAFDTAGRSLARGARHWLSDLRRNGGMPAQTDRNAFTVGRDLALSPGAVVHRTEVLEVLQYNATTPTVRKRPLVVVPPPIGRYYFLDLRPGRSFVEYAVSQGFQVFLLSWRNPTNEHADWDLDTYAGAILDAIDVPLNIPGK